MAFGKVAPKAIQGLAWIAKHILSGTGVTVTYKNGKVTISIGQNVATSSSPTFANETLTGNLTAQGTAHVFGNGGTAGGNINITLNGQSGSGFPGAGITGKRNGTIGWFIGDYSAVQGGGALDQLWQNFNAGAGWRFLNSLSANVFTISNTGDFVCTGSVLPGNATVTGLPTGIAGMRYTVTDSTVALSSSSIGNTVVGGGSNKVPVFFDGTHWIIG